MPVTLTVTTAGRRRRDFSPATGTVTVLDASLSSSNGTTITGVEGNPDWTRARSARSPTRTRGTAVRLHGDDRLGWCSARGRPPEPSAQPGGGGNAVRRERFVRLQRRRELRSHGHGP